MKRAHAAAAVAVMTLSLPATADSTSSRPKKRVVEMTDREVPVAPVSEQLESGEDKVLEKFLDEGPFNELAEESDNETFTGLDNIDIEAPANGIARVEVELPADTAMPTPRAASFTRQKPAVEPQGGQTTAAATAAVGNVGKTQLASAAPGRSPRSAATDTSGKSPDADHKVGSVPPVSVAAVIDQSTPQPFSAAASLDQLNPADTLALQANVDNGANASVIGGFALLGLLIATAARAVRSRREEEE